MFVILSFLALYKILNDDKLQYWLLFIISSLCAAYTHYYCLVSVAFFYIVLIFDVFIRKKSNIKKIVLTCIVTVIVYLPWFFVLLESFYRTTNDFWLEAPQEIMYCLEYIFQSKFSLLFFVVFIICIISLIILEVLKKEKIENIIWIIAGLVALFGTLVVGTAISILVRPMFIARYLFPISMVAWLLMGIAISKFKYKRVFTFILIVMILWSGIKEYAKIYTEEMISNEILEETLEITTEEMKIDDVIVTDNVYIIWTVAELYYPQNECIPFRDFDALSNLDTIYWFIFSNKLEDTIICELESKGFEINLVIEDGVLGTYPVSIYKICGVTE